MFVLPTVSMLRRLVATLTSRSSGYRLLPLGEFPPPSAIYSVAVRRSPGQDLLEIGLLDGETVLCQPSPGESAPTCMSRLEAQMLGELRAQAASSCSTAELHTELLTTLQREIMLQAVHFLEALLVGAAALRWTDLHLQVTSGVLRVEGRCRGELVHLGEYPAELAPRLTTRLRVLCGLPLLDTAKGQDGSLQLHEPRPLAVRVSFIPTTQGESLALRLHSAGEIAPDLAEIGFAEADRVLFGAILRQQQGLFLVCGPANSGKSTCLHACLRALSEAGAKQRRRVISLEDPVEYHIAGITQVPVGAVRGPSFAEALRGVLRGDPEVLCIGEIRDQPTAEIAVQAALTGHLILASVHAADPEQAVRRLVGLGVSAATLGECVLGGVGLRLARAAGGGLPEASSSGEARRFVGLIPLCEWWIPRAERLGGEVAVLLPRGLGAALGEAVSRGEVTPEEARRVLPEG